VAIDAARSHDAPLRPFAAVFARASFNTSAYIASDSIACQKARKD